MSPSSTNKRKSSDAESQLRKIRKKLSDAPKTNSTKVTVKVGRQEKLFIVDEDKLKNHSEFFKTALNNQWKEDQERTVALPDEEDPELFEIFCHFVNTGVMYTEKDGDVDADDALEDGEWERLADLWSLGERLLSTSLRDATVDSMVEKMEAEKMHPLNLFPSIYKAGHQKSAARKLVVDIAIWNWSQHELERSEVLQGGTEFLLDLVRAMGLIRQLGRGPNNLAPFKDVSKRCQYHDHVAEGKPCYQTMF